MRKHVDATPKNPLQARSRSGCSFQCQTFEEGGGTSGSGKRRVWEMLTLELLDISKAPIG